jgi:hypothetical protein
LRESAWKSPPQCRHLDEETEPATGRKKTSPGRQAEGQITSDGADGKKTGRRKKRWRSIRKKTPPKNPAKPWFSNRQIYAGFGTVLTGGLSCNYTCNHTLPKHCVPSPLKNLQFFFTFIPYSEAQGDNTDLEVGRFAQKCWVGVCF